MRSWLTSVPISPYLIISLGCYWDYFLKIQNKSWIYFPPKHSVVFIHLHNKVWTTSRSFNHLVSTYLLSLNFFFILLHILDFCTNKFHKHFHIALSSFMLIPHPECLRAAFIVMEILAQLKYLPLIKPWVYSQLKVIALSCNTWSKLIY